MGSLRGWGLGLTLRVQVPSNHTYTLPNIHLDNYYPQPKYLIIGSFGPLGLGSVQHDVLVFGAPDLTCFQAPTRSGFRINQDVGLGLSDKKGVPYVWDPYHKDPTI